MKWEWIVGRYPEETSYTISYIKLDGSRAQDSYNEANGPGGVKILSVCKLYNTFIKLNLRGH